ncbi:hypothetical protein RI367_001964 [Sorochytrium milnesiophthora]
MAAAAPPPTMMMATSKSALSSLIRTLAQDQLHPQNARAVRLNRPPFTLDAVRDHANSQPANAANTHAAAAIAAAHHASNARAQPLLDSFFVSLERNFEAKCVQVVGKMRLELIEQLKRQLADQSRELQRLLDQQWAAFRASLAERVTSEVNVAVNAALSRHLAQINAAAAPSAPTSSRRQQQQAQPAASINKGVDVDTMRAFVQESMDKLQQNLMSQHTEAFVTMSSEFWHRVTLPLDNTMQSVEELSATVAEHHDAIGQLQNLVDGAPPPLPPLAKSDLSEPPVAPRVAAVARDTSPPISPVVGAGRTPTFASLDRKVDNLCIELKAAMQNLTEAMCRYDPSLQAQLVHVLREQEEKVAQQQSSEPARALFPFHKEGEVASAMDVDAGPSYTAETGAESTDNAAPSPPPPPQQELQMPVVVKLEADLESPDPYVRTSASPQVRMAHSSSVPSASTRHGGSAPSRGGAG